MTSARPQSARPVKRRVVHAIQKYLLNPPVRLSLSIGVVPPSYALLEVTGRNSGQPRRTPVGNGLVGETFWIVSEYGARFRLTTRANGNGCCREGILGGS